VVKLKLLGALVCFLIAAQPTFGDDGAKILGIWKIVSWDLESQATGAKEPTFGEHPMGYIIFTPEGRMVSIITAQGRQAPKTDQDRAELLKSMIAYTGMYRLEGDKYITKVDVSVNPVWVGTEQVSFFRFDGDRLQITTAWLQSTTRPQAETVRAIMTFERAK
jgi:hypothetical protein